MLIKKNVIGAFYPAEVIKIWTLYLLKKDASTKGHEVAAPELALIEIAIGACGVVTATINVISILRRE